MCDSWRLPPPRELTVAEVAEVFGRLGRLDVVRLTGGEPLLRADLPELVEAVLRRSRPLVVHVTTNGSLPHRAVELVRGCSSPHKLRLMVSFDGLAEVHDRNRGSPAGFRLALETVRLLAELRRTHGFGLSVNHTVISERSLADGPGLQALMAKLQVEVHSVLAYADSAIYGIRLQGRSAEHLLSSGGYPLHPDLRAADTAGFLRRELARTGRCSDLLLRWGKRYYLRGLLARVECAGDRRRSIRPGPPCVALRSHLRLLPDGRVPVCQFNSRTVGNLKDQSWTEVWHGPRAVAARRWVDACPGCWAECEVIPSALYSGDILRGL